MTARIITAANVRWLVAETLVIVFGVLIALGLDDYRTERYERRLAIEYIERIQADVNQDLGYLTEVWYPRLKMKRDALDLVAPVIRGRTPVPDGTEEFFLNISRGGILGASAVNWFTDTTFRDLRATGNLRLIRSPHIRGKIGLYYELLESGVLRTESRFTDYMSFVHTVIPGELREEIDMDSLEEFGVDYALQRLLSGDFRNLVNEEYNAMLFMESQDYEGLANSLLEDLESYRHELEAE